MKFHYGSGLTEKDRVDGPYPVVSSAGIQGTHNTFLSEGPGVVIGRKGNVGQVTYIEDSFWTIDTAYYIEIKEKYKGLPLKFFSYLLESANLKKYSIATAVPGLNRDDALLTNICLPEESTVNDFIIEIENIEACITQIELQKKNTKSLKNNIASKVF
jgi:type I restriction enzyme S subunit